MRLVLETNVVTSVLLLHGKPRRLLDAARAAQIDLFTSLPLLAELSGILNRPKFAAKIAASGLSVDRIVMRYAQLALPVRPAMIPPTIRDDPDDDRVLACAFAARAELIVSGDHLLLDLEYSKALTSPMWPVPLNGEL